MANKANTYKSWVTPFLEYYQDSINKSAHEHTYNSLVEKANKDLLGTHADNFYKLDLKTLIELKESSNREGLLKELNLEKFNLDDAKIDVLIEWSPEYRNEFNIYIDSLTIEKFVKTSTGAIGEVIGDKIETVQNIIDNQFPLVNDAIAKVSDNTGEAINNLINEFPQISGLLQEVSKGAEKVSGSISEFMADFNAMEAADVGLNSLAGGITSAVSLAIYSALKEFLSLEGKRRKGKISNGEVIKQVCQIALEGAKKGVGIGVVFALAIMIFGEWLLIPLTVMAPFATIKMGKSLWESFWDGLDEYQHQELIKQADELKIDISNLFSFV